jgi:hypothetical protein
MKYWLKNITDDLYEYPIFEVEIEKLNKYFCDFTVYKATSWESDYSNIYEKKFIAEVHWKWDFCTHWYFYGEDYYESAEKDSYYHICSDHSDYIRMFAFIRKLMYSLLGDKQDWYKDKELDELILKGFEIVEVK